MSRIRFTGQASTLQSLTQAIDRSSGIRIREEGGVGSEFDLSINGMSGNSIRYFLDGMPLDAKGTGMTLANLPVNIIERVEIYKGVIPVSFGSDALGGAVNIVTNRSRRNYLDFSYGIGSFHTHKADFSAQYTGKKTGLIFKPVISANYSKNDYLMRDVKVRNEEHTAFVIKDLPRFHDDYLSLFGQMEVGVADRSWADAFFVSASVSKVDKDIQTGATQDRVIGMAERHTQSLNVSARYEKVDFLTDGMQFQVSASHTMDHSQTIDTTYRRYYWDGSYIDGSYSEIRSRGKTLRHYHRPLTVVRSNLSYRLAEGHELALNYVFNRAGNRQTDDWDTDFVPTDDVLAKHIAGLVLRPVAALRPPEQRVLREGLRQPSDDRSERASFDYGRECRPGLRHEELCGIWPRNALSLLRPAGRQGLLRAQRPAADFARTAGQRFHGLSQRGAQTGDQ